MKFKTLIHTYKILILHYVFALCRRISENHTELSKMICNVVLRIFLFFKNDLDKLCINIWLHVYYDATSQNRQYQKWIENHHIFNSNKTQSAITWQPKISIVMPVYNAEEKLLSLAIKSIIKQNYSNWELCVVDDKSESAHMKNTLSDFAKSDTRIKTCFLDEHLGIALATNHGIQMCIGDYIGFVDHDDELYEDALFEVVLAINKHSDYKIFYTDEDKISLDGKRVEIGRAHV